VHNAWGMYAGGTSKVVFDSLVGGYWLARRGGYTLELLTEMGTSYIANSGANVK
jgi:hypothetical protein